MTVVSTTIFHPIPGKAAKSLERIRRTAEILTRAGARARVANVAWGDGAGDIHLYGIVENSETAAKVTAAFYADPAFAALRAETEQEQTSRWEGPEFWRTIFGEVKPGYPVLVQREYQMDRRHLKSAMALLPEVQKVVGETPVIALVPTLSSDMARMMVVYYAKSLLEVGQSMDMLATSEAFQSILVRAAETGKLTKSRALVTV